METSALFFFETLNFLHGLLVHDNSSYYIFSLCTFCGFNSNRYLSSLVH